MTVIVSANRFLLDLWYAAITLWPEMFRHPFVHREPFWDLSGLLEFRFVCVWTYGNSSRMRVYDVVVYHINSYCTIYDIYL